MNRLLFWANVLLKVLDVATTAYLVNLYGTAAEANPIIRTMFSAYGIWPTFVIAFSIFFAAMVVLYKKEQRNLLILSAIFMLAVVCNNTYAMTL